MKKSNLIKITFGAILISVIAFTIGFYVGISTPDPKPEPFVSVTRISGSRTTDDTNPHINNVSGHVMFVEGGSVKLRLYYMNDGKNTLKGELVIDPEIHPFVGLSQYIKAD
ncbi:MAG: hypothetical protein AB8C95_15825, partial [Phycisphaeraceae bacterium]